MTIQTLVTHNELNIQAAHEFVLAKNCGAVVHFMGTVRDHNLGLPVSSLEYKAYEAMAEKLLKSMAQKAQEQFQVEHIYLAHRLGHLQLSDISVLISVATHHRDDAYKASRFLIEAIKQDLPVWKKEHYVGKNPEWVQCSHHHHHANH